MAEADGGGTGLLRGCLWLMEVGQDWLGGACG